MQKGRVGRGSKIRTCDPLVPNQMRYQAALCPDVVGLGLSTRQRFVKAEQNSNIQHSTNFPGKVTRNSPGQLSPMLPAFHARFPRCEEPDKATMREHHQTPSIHPSAFATRNSSASFSFEEPARRSPGLKPDKSASEALCTKYPFSRPLMFSRPTLFPEWTS